MPKKYRHLGNSVYTLLLVSLLQCYTIKHIVIVINNILSIFN